MKHAYASLEERQYAREERYAHVEDEFASLTEAHAHVEHELRLTQDALQNELAVREETAMFATPAESMGGYGSRAPHLFVRDGATPAAKRQQALASVCRAVCRAVIARRTVACRSLAGSFHRWRSAAEVQTAGAHTVAVPDGAVAEIREMTALAVARTRRLTLGLVEPTGGDGALVGGE